MTKLFSGHLPRWGAAIFLFGFACGQTFADGELKNGDFVETMRMRDDPNEQLLPKNWFASEPETTGNPWVKVLTDDGPGVEIKGAETSRYLYQDVSLDGTKTWTLKWKCKGTGTAALSVLPRDDDGNIFPGATENLQLGDAAEEHELAIPMPSTTKKIRIILAPAADSVVTFQDVQLTSSD